MAGALSALCQSWNRPGPSPAVTDNGFNVAYGLETSRAITPKSIDLNEVTTAPQVRDESTRPTWIVP